MAAACQGPGLTASPVPGFPAAGMGETWCPWGNKSGCARLVLPTGVGAGQTLLCPVLPVPPAAAATALPLLYCREVGAFTLVGKWKMPGPHSMWNTPTIPWVQCVLWKQLPTHPRPQTEGRERKEHYLCFSAQAEAMHISYVQSSLAGRSSFFLMLSDTMLMCWSCIDWHLVRRQWASVNSLPDPVLVMLPLWPPALAHTIGIFL